MKKLFKIAFNPLFISAFAVILLVYSGVFSIKSRTPYHSLVPLQNVVDLEGVVSSNPSVNSRNTFYNCSVKVKSVTGLIETGGLKYSLTCSAYGEINVAIPSDYVDGLKPGKLYSPSGTGFLVETGSHITARCCYSSFNGGLKITEIKECSFNKTLSGRIQHFRAWCRLIFKRLLYGWGNAGALVISLLSGSREYLDEKFRNSFMASGLSHILALSGMHLSFFSGIAAKAGRKTAGRKYVFIFQLSAILLFIWFAGRSPSLFRALLCSLFMLLTGVLNLKACSSFLILCFVFLFHCVLYPQDVMTSAFQLSYTALAGIMIFSDYFNNRLSPYLPSFFSSSLASSISANILTAPVTLSLFGCLTPQGIIATVIVSPFISLFMGIAAAGFVLCLIMPFLSPLFSCILNVLYEIIFHIVHFFALIPPVTF